jgi:hypothetical protein
MDNKPTIVHFPVAPLQKFIPLELTMAREIPRENVTTELLHAKLEDAGYEAVIDDDEIEVKRTGFNLRIHNFPDHGSLRFRTLIYLNESLSDEEINALVAKTNVDAYAIRLAAVRWPETNIGLFSNYVVHYPFGLNLPNFVYSLRSTVDATQRIFQDHINGTRYEYVVE